MQGPLEVRTLYQGSHQLRYGNIKIQKGEEGQAIKAKSDAGTVEGGNPVSGVPPVTVQAPQPPKTPQEHGKHWQRLEDFVKSYTGTAGGGSPVSGFPPVAVQRQPQSQETAQDRQEIKRRGDEGEKVSKPAEPANNSNSDTASTQGQGREVTETPAKQEREERSSVGKQEKRKAPEEEEDNRKDRRINM